MFKANCTLAVSSCLLHLWLYFFVLLLSSAAFFLINEKENVMEEVLFTSCMKVIYREKFLAVMWLRIDMYLVGFIIKYAANRNSFCINEKSVFIC
jgi:hypothetical protein